MSSANATPWPSSAWLHTFSPGLLLTVSPFIHFNRADYDSDPNDVPISTIQHLDSTYGGAQISLNSVTRNHDARIGVYGFAQHDDEFVRLMANDGSGLNVQDTDQPRTDIWKRRFSRTSGNWVSGLRSPAESA